MAKSKGDGVGINLEVGGISEFKKNIDTAKQSLKTLDAHLQLNEKQFKLTGDSESYMQTKTELLQIKMKEQSAVVEQAEKALEQMSKNGVDKASDSYQKMQRELLNAKSGLVDAEMQINNVTDAGAEAGNEVSGMNAQLKRIGDGVNYQNVIEGLGSITSGMQKVVRKAWDMGEAIVKATLGAGSWADELKTEASRYGIDPEELQRMRKTATLIDTDVDMILSARQKMEQGIGKRDKETMGAFAALLGDWDPTAKKAEDNFWAVGEALMNLEDEYDKQVYAQKLFGRSWKELVPLFTTGRKEYEKTMDSWSVVENDQLDALGKMDDAYQKMTSEWETFKMEMLSAFSGPLTEGMDTITSLFKELNEYLDTPEGQKALSQIGETVSSLIHNLTEIDPETVVGGLKSVIDGITDALKWVDEHSDDVVIAMKTIVGGWGLLKLAGGAAQVLELVNGIRGLTGAAAGTAGNAIGASWGAAFGSAVMKASPYLAFLYTLLNPAGSAGEQLDSLVDKNGNLTEAGRAAGHEIDENGNMTGGRYVIPGEGRKYNKYQEEKIQELWDLYRTDSLDAEAIKKFRSDTLITDDNFRRLMEDIYRFRGSGTDWKEVTDLPASFFEEATNGARDAGKEINEAAGEMGKLPEKVAAAVTSALAGTRVVIDGVEMSAVIGQVMAGTVARYVV